MAALDPYEFRDNARTVKSQLPTLLIIPEVHESLGIIADRERVPLLVQDSDGKESVT